ncbi:tRNA (32-2'-O)-methyltransferase regulator THADA-like [Lytechinus pictus]|uniref:tRNA (32-2'-O)-methyltransferase regulator THADA-like n=1 Tax=Lytechinus pictus TaxID=7653 RepID=UPI0030B9CAC8
MAHLSLFKSRSKSVKNSARKTSCWEEILQSLKEFAEKIERNDRNIKQWQVLADSITSKTQQAVKGISGSTASRNSSNNKRPSQGILDDLVSRFCWVFFEAAIDVKLVRKLHKGAQALSEVCPKLADVIDCQFVVLVSENGGLMKNIQASKVSNLLEGSPLVHSPLAKHFPQFLAAMNRTTTSLIAEVSSNVPGTALHPDVTACCSTLSKLALQMCQLVPLQLGGILDGAQDRVGSGQEGDLVFQLSGLVGNLVIMMCSKKFSRENGLMSGCAVGMLFNSSPTPKYAVSMAINLLHSFHQGSSQSITDFNSDLGFFNRLVGPPFQDFSPPEKAFGALCLARGLITCGDVKILLERIPTGEGDNEGQIFLIGPLLTVTQELLSSQDTPEFHSIQLFTLWLQCVQRHLQHLRSLLNNNAQRFLTRSSDVVQLVLSCIWRHWHSPIDGVPEQIRALFSSLLDSYKAESHLLNSSDTQLLTYLAQELLGSPIHLKGRYTLLSTLIPHLGATAVLDLHPRLSRELLSCLDTHHLVFAANETYKTLISGIKSELAQDPAVVQGERKEEFKETALKIWAKHFQEVVITGLCSNNALVRNNIANTWLPATFKIFPETFPMLLDVNVIMRGGHDQEARNLHRKIILLKQARTCKILQGQEWMQHHLATLEEAAHHHNDDIRGDTIYLVCHSPRTAEPVDEDETRLVKTLVKNCLTTDDTSLRNQLRISMKALIFRLRDSSLAWLKKINSAMAFAASSVDSGTEELSPATKALQTNLQSAVDLMDWLLEESFSLFPGACYQRKRASLDLLRLIYENLSDGKQTELNNPSSAALSAASKKLLSWSRDIGKVDLFSERNASLLVNSLLDSSNDIRSSAYDLLIGYFPWPLPSSPAYPWSRPSEILVQGMKLICSPKFHECEAGAMLCKLSFHRQIVEREGLDDLVKPSKNKSTTSGKATKSSTLESPVQFVLSLMESLRYQVKCAKINILRAAALTPMHGIIMAIRKCLTEDTRIFHRLVTDEPETWQAIVKELNTMLHQIIMFILDLLAGRTKQSESKDEGLILQDFVAKDVGAKTKEADSVAMETGNENSSARQDVSIPTHEPDTVMDTAPTSNKGSELREGAPGMPSSASKDGELSHLSPSFGKMGEEIEKLVTDFGTEDDDDGAGALSLEHQLILSCCWLTLKESSLLMGALAEVSSPSGAYQTRLLDRQQFELMSKSLVQILTKCRHKGALEGCKIGFFKVCAAMLSCPDSDIASIPKSLLDLVLTVITTTASSTSYTKKSAGLPPLVESIIVAEPRGRERHLLKYVMTKLMEIAQQPLPTQPDAKQDLPQSHALNIMKSLFVNSSLAWEVLPYAEEAIQLAIDGFASSNWMVQNSSMQLLGSLIARIFGQKKVQDEHSQVNTLSASEFFQRYPRLRLYLLQEVRKAAALHQRGSSSAPEGGRLHLVPTLHPVLLVLTKLGSGITTEGQKRELEEFIEPICSLASSPVYSVRDLASRAILPLLAQNEEVSNMAAQLLDTIPPSSTSLIASQNRLHGNLLLIQRLLTSCINKKSLQEEKVQELTDKFMSRLWVGSSRNPCPITRALFMKICTLWWENAFPIKPNCVTSLIVKSMNIHEQFFTSSPSFQVGLSYLGQEMTASFISMSEFIPDQISNLSSLTHILLTHDLSEVRELALKYMIDNMTSAAELSMETQASGQFQVLELLLEEDSMNCVTLALDLWVGLSKYIDAKAACDLQPLLECLLGMTATQIREMSFCAVVLPALSIALRLNSDNFKNMNLEMTSHWCDLVLKCSDPSQCETVRLSAAKSLKHSGVQALNTCDPSNITHCDFAFMIMKAGMLLLQDEQPEIREEAARFASLIPREGALLNDVHGNHLHCSTGLKILLDSVCAKFCVNINFLDTVISLLIGDAFIVEDLIYEETHRDSLNLFEQESVNMYAEGVMEANLVFHALTDAMSVLVEHKADIMREWIKDRWHFIEFNMASLIKYLDKHPVAANSFYAGTGHSKPYQALYRLLMYVWLLQTASILIKPPIEGVLEVKQKIEGYLKSMQKMYYVFPLLKESIPTDLTGEAQSQEME